MLSLKILTLPVAMVLSATYPTDKPETISLHEAIEKEILEVEVLSKGGFSGNCIQLNVINVRSKRMDIQLVKGTLFKPENAEAQNIVVPETQVLAFTGARSQEFTITGYCSEPDDRSPKQGSHFKVSQSKNQLHDDLFAYLEDKPELLDDKQLMQSAIWALEKGEPVACIYKRNNPEVASLREYICSITGKENVWYNRQEELTVTEDLRIVSNPLAVSGEIKIVLEKPMQIDGYVIDAAGEKVWSYPSKIDLPEGDIQFWFELAVEHWEEGTYSIVYTHGSETLLMQEFTI